ncbi:MAG: globin domain-containing protein [Parasphingorhabdus sp.]|uniref:globin domain-containing protein n=1 Tax=Parasphingorhabdus sp. TaxID=2709688 RepID=UPI00329A023E
MGHQSKIQKCLTVAEIDIIRRSYLTVGAENARAGELFYQHLFQNKPELRALFVGDIAGQSSALANMLGMIVSQIQNLPELLPMLGDLARRHIDYGVRPEHFEDVSDALIAMLQDILGPKFDSAVEAAWLKAYDGIALTMIGICFGDAGLLRYRKKTPA